MRAFLCLSLIVIRFGRQPSSPLRSVFGRSLVGEWLVLGWSSNRKFSGH